MRRECVGILIYLFKMHFNLYNRGGCRPYGPPSLPQLWALTLNFTFIINKNTINESYNEPMCD